LTKLISWFLCLALLLGGLGCGGKQRSARKQQPPEEGSVVAAPSLSTYEHPDETNLEDSIRGRSISATEVANMSDRMLAEGSSTFTNQKTMARLDILLNKSLDSSSKDVRYRLLRNLGIIHYHQNKISLSRQELQQANELFPRDARTHFYLARLAAQNGNIFQSKGLSKKAKGQFTLAANELELARKLEPSNPLYRQDVRQLIQKERPLATDLKK
jgi:tetratricopeptide (TPR) repeat protein